MYRNPKIKNVYIDYGRMELNEENAVEYGLQLGMNCFSMERVAELLAMAIEDVWPDIHYSDSECCLWGELRRVLMKEGLKEWDV